jgi:hypothetical protein
MSRAREVLMFSWSSLDAAGEEVGRSHGFPDEESAEEWMGSSWPDLAENGVEEVVLYDQGQGRRMYRMGLGAD